MIQELVLRELNTDDEMAFLNGLNEWSEADRSWFTFVWKPGMSHEEHLKALADNKDQSKISNEFVPSTMLYGFSDNVIVGRFNIRHYLNKNLEKRGGHVGYAVNPTYRGRGYATEMFRLGLDYCKKMNLKKILITCSDSNVPSWKIIEKFNGKLENTVLDKVKNEHIRRYWLEFL